jgi:TonB family protein
MAALVLSPLMVHAQASKPAQPKAASKPVQLASAAGEDRPTAPVRTLRVSTGVVAPKLVHTVEIRESQLNLMGPAGEIRTAVVSMVVDETGKPSDLKLLQPATPALNQAILDAVSQFRFEPGTVSGQTVAVPVNLHITIEQSAE